MKILVTGGCGFIGHNVVSILEQAGHDVRIIDTMTDYNLIPRKELDYLLHARVKKIKSPIHPISIDDPGINKFFASYSPDIVIHLASFPRQKIVNANPCLGSRAMSEGLLNLLEASVNHSVKKFIYISSSMVYGDFPNNVVEQFSCNPKGQYAIMKYAGELLVKDYANRSRMIYTIIRPSAVYGELDAEDRVVSKFMLAALRDETLKVNGSEEVLDFTHVSDVAEGIVSAALHSVTNNKTYNITRSQGCDLLAAANLIVKIAGSGNVKCFDRDSAFPSRGTLSIEAAITDFGYNPKVSIEQGFARYYDWIKNVYSKEITLTK